MKILGIDPGFAILRIGLVETSGPQDIQALDWLTIKTKAGIPLPNRLVEIANDLSKLIEEFKPELAVVEKIFFSTNKKSAIDVAQARGVIIQTAAMHGIPILEATPMQLKSCITGDGKADKKQIQDMLVHMFKLKEIPQPDDAADALALAAYGALHPRALS